MQQGRLLAIIGLIASSLHPQIAPAQGSSGIELYSAYNNSFPGGAGVGGFGLTLGAGPIGLRGTFGVGLPSFSATTPVGSPPASSRWAGDADLLIAADLSGLGGLLNGIVRPYAFAGLGAQSQTSSPTIADAVRTWSYGGGFALPISATVALDAELRNRSHLGSIPIPSTSFVSGPEYRVGIRVGFGGSRGGGSSSSGRIPSGSGSGSSGSRAWPASNVMAAGAARRVVPDAEQYIGVPYVWGGSTPKGFDCSGFVQYVYAREGVKLPRTSRQMAGAGTAVEVTPSRMAIGDLLLFADGGEVSHVAIYAGAGRIIHSTSSGGGVRYDDLAAQRGRWFADHLVAVRRVATGAGAGERVAGFANAVIAFDHFDPPDLAPPVRKPR